MITPMDIHNKEFETGFRGYSKEAVDTFMAEINKDYEVLYRENRELKEKIEHLEKRIAQYEQMEETMNNTLVLAQETGENVKAASRKEAELIIQDAQAQRQSILDSAESSLREARDRYAIIRNDIAVFRTKMESILHSQLKILEDLVLDDRKLEETIRGNAEAARESKETATPVVTEDNTTTDAAVETTAAK